MTSQAQLDAYDRQVRVATAAAMISLDCIRPILGEMGLGLAEPDVFGRAVRNAILAYRERAKDATSIADTPLDFEAELLATVAAEVGEGEAVLLQRFVDHVFNRGHSELPHWSAWRIAFHFCAHKPGQHDALKLPHDRRNRLLEDYVEMLDITEVERQLKSLATQPLSDWDVEMCVRRSWDPKDEDAAPFGIAAEVVRTHRFQLYAHQLVTALNGAELTTVRAAAAQLIERRGVWMPEPLAPLSSLMEAMA